jgi:hypothetical protein
LIANLPLGVTVTANSSVLGEFERRLYSDWLPAYCRDPRRGYRPDGFRHSSITVTEEDASDFISALEHKLITDDGHGNYRIPQSNAKVFIFWPGLKSSSPRSISLWVEPVITIAVVARLHLDFGWPMDQLGMESKDWAFDFTASRPFDSSKLFLAGEVKKTSKELDELLTKMTMLCAARQEITPPENAKLRNAYKKWVGLVKTHAHYFWAVGPGKVSHLFEVQHLPGGYIAMRPVDDAPLKFDANAFPPSA